MNKHPAARLHAAQAARDLAKLNLERTTVRAPVDGYVTNLQVHAGDYAAAGAVLHGHVDSIARGITDRDATGAGLLADVHPTFNWVWRAQRVPVRIALDKVPQGMMLVAGSTCTVEVAGS
jgi:multidrug resistance efflux pump